MTPTGRTRTPGVTPATLVGRPGGSVLRTMFCTKDGRRRADVEVIRAGYRPRGADVIRFVTVTGGPYGPISRTNHGQTIKEA